MEALGDEVGRVGGKSTKEEGGRNFWSACVGFSSPASDLLHIPPFVATDQCSGIEQLDLAKPLRSFLLDLRISSVVRRQTGGVPQHATGCTVLQLCEGLTCFKWGYLESLLRHWSDTCFQKGFETAVPCGLALAHFRVLASRGGYGGLCSLYLWIALQTYKDGFQEFTSVCFGHIGPRCG